MTRLTARAAAQEWTVIPMREILFRGKAINRSEGGEYRTNYKNGDWVYGLVTKMFDERYKELPAEMTNTNGIKGIEVDYRTIEQYTGLTDKNGKRIFEGDIVSSGTINPYTISFNQTLCCFYLKRCDLECGGFFTAGDAKCIEVIGNIYDNPELQTIERTYINERENRRSTKEYY